MAGNRIYVQGSYIDVHDNENVYLSVDKAEVRLNGNVQSAKDGSAEVGSLPDVLASEAAKRYWARLQKAGFVDEHYQLLPETTRKQAMYIADVFADKLRLKAKWKTFERLWGIGNLAQEKWDMQQTGSTPSRSKEIDMIFED